MISNKNNVYGKNFGEIEKILKELNIPLINIKEKKKKY